MDDPLARDKESRLATPLKGPKNAMGSRGAALALSLFLLPVVPLAQTTGDIDGRVTDASGSPLSGVTVEAKSPSLPGVRSSVTGRDGD